MIKYFSFFFVSLLLILAGCSSNSQDCSSLDTTYQKYYFNSDSKECEAKTPIKQNVCGNGVIEESDKNYCNCPIDDGGDIPKSHLEYGCDGDKGDYLSYMCSNKQTCVLTQNDKVISQTKSVEFKNSDIIFNGDFNINKPLIVNIEEDNEIKVDLEYFKTQTSSKISNIFVKEMIIENSASIKFAEISYNEKLDTPKPAYSFTQKSFKIADTAKYLTKETLKVKLIIGYTKDTLDFKGEITKTENKIETLTASLGTWEIINPIFDN